MTDIYLVDDHAMLRDGLRALLEAAGHRVVGEADEPTRALADLGRLQPALLLLDLHLGERSGMELLAEMQHRKLPTRTLVLTMSAQPRHVAEAMRLGAAGYVLKGASAPELLQAIERVLQGHRHLGPDVAELALTGLTAAAPTPLAALPPRERQIVALVARGRTSAEIGAQLHLAPKTVDSYRSRLMAQLGVGDLASLVRLAIREGLVSADD
ncbi:MAG: response regulator transcription factor [Rubrivivax sp.]|nr:response regulator transcription factor [Rubrivivax sp.]